MNTAATYQEAVLLHCKSQINDHQDVSKENKAQRCHLALNITLCLKYNALRFIAHPQIISRIISWEVSEYNSYYGKLGTVKLNYRFPECFFWCFTKRTYKQAKSATNVSTQRTKERMYWQAVIIFIAMTWTEKLISRCSTRQASPFRADHKYRDTLWVD